MAVKFLPSLFVVISVAMSFIFSNCNILILRDVATREENQSFDSIEIVEKDEENSPSVVVEDLGEESPIVETEEPVESEYIEVSREDVDAIARTLYGECRGVPSDMEKAAVAWVILNRVDTGFGDTVLEVVSAEGQFTGYDPSYPVLEELELLAEDVLIRWSKEKLGYTDVGRVLPLEYVWFHGDGEHNYFRDSFRGGTRWDWSLSNPYEN